jgi:hypothetical protein
MPREIGIGKIKGGGMRYCVNCHYYLPESSTCDNHEAKHYHDAVDKKHTCEVWEVPNTFLTKDPTCPYCGETWQWNPEYDDDQIDCDNCGEKYSMEVSYSWSFCTEKIKKEE